MATPTNDKPIAVQQLVEKKLDGTAKPCKTMTSKQQIELIGAIDQGTSSTRFLVFENGTGQLVASSQVEVKRIVPKEGWVEMDPMAIMNSVYDTINEVAIKLQQQPVGCKRSNNLAANMTHPSSLDGDRQPSPVIPLKDITQLKCIGICNQRESTLVWDAITGRPLYNAIVWMDNRTKDLVDDMIDLVPGRDFNWLKDKTGLPMSTYFSAFKLKWLIDNVQEVKLALKEKRLIFGTVDTWILWNLTGNHMTDVTNASRTFLMDIETLEWDKTLCKHFNIPMNILPKILSSADDFGLVRHGPLKGLPITGVIGDQSGALFGHNCLQLGQTKATFGTGCFIMQNIGPGPLNGALSGVQREAKRGLITTVGYKLKDRPACYALEGSIKIAGAAITWLRDNLQLISDYSQCDQLVNTTTNTAGVFFVPALGGLYSPYWDPNASGTIIGLSQFTRREHLIRATFDSIAFQTNDILSLMRGVTSGLMIDGGICKSDNMCQILADITGCDIVRPSMCETSALGAAMVAGCGAGIWSYESMLAESRSSQNECTNSQHQNHHYPHESLHYEERFSSIIELKRNDFQQQVIDQCREHTACDDAGGGREANIYAGGGPNSYEDDEGVDEGGCEEDDDVESQLISTDTEDYLGVQNSGEFSSIDYAERKQHQAVRPAGSEVASGQKGTICERDESDFIRQITDDSTCQQHLKPKVQRARHTPSSGYSSGDFESLAGGQHVRLGTPSSDSHELASSASTVGERCCEELDARSKSPSSDLEKRTADDTRCWIPQQQVPQAETRRSSRFSSVSEMSACLRDYISKSTNNNSDYDEHDYDDTDNCETNKRNGYKFAPILVRSRRKPDDVFQSYISLEHRTELVNTWRQAVERSMQWTKIHHEEIRKIDYQRLSSLPISMYLFFSIGMVALSGLMSAINGRSLFTG